MKHYTKILLLTLAAFCLSCSSGEYGKFALEEELIPYQDKNSDLWGYMNWDGETVIEPVYKNEPGLFHNGYALVRADQEEGDYSRQTSFFFINAEGEQAGETYLQANRFSEGLACVVKEFGSPTYINTSFEEVIVLDSALQAGPFSDGMAPFQGMDGQWGFIDKNGEVAIAPQFIRVNSFSDGLAVVGVKKGKYGQMLGVINKKGEYTMQPQTEINRIGLFSNGVAPYGEGRYYGIIDSEGKKVERARDWADLSEFNNGYATFKTRVEFEVEGKSGRNSTEKESLWGLVNEDGEVVIEPSYEYAIHFYNNVMINIKYDFEKPASGYERWYYNTDGDRIIEDSYAASSLPFLGGNAIAKVANDWILIDSDGDEIKELPASEFSEAWEKKSWAAHPNLVGEPLVNTVHINSLIEKFAEVNEKILKIDNSQPAVQLLEGFYPEDFRFSDFYANRRSVYQSYFAHKEEIAVPEKLRQATGKFFIRSTFRFSKRFGIRVPSALAQEYQGHDGITDYMPNPESKLKYIEVDLNTSRLEGNHARRFNENILNVIAQSSGFTMKEEKDRYGRTAINFYDAAGNKRIELQDTSSDRSQNLRYYFPEETLVSSAR